MYTCSQRRIRPFCIKLFQFHVKKVRSGSETCCHAFYFCIVEKLWKNYIKCWFFTAPVTGDVWLQDGQIKEEEEEGSESTIIPWFGSGSDLAQKVPDLTGSGSTTLKKGGEERSWWLMFKCMITTSTNVFFLGIFFGAYTVQSTVSIIVEYRTPVNGYVHKYSRSYGLLALTSHEWYSIQFRLDAPDQNEMRGCP